MRLSSRLSLLTALLAALSFIPACGGSDDAPVLNGVVDGCQIATYGTKNILVGVFARGTGNSPIEVATSLAYIDPAATVHGYSIVLDGKPPASAVRVGSDVQYVELFVQGYIDANENYRYDPSERLLEPAELKLAYFFSNEDSTHARKGYNYQDPNTSLFAQDFSAVDPTKEGLVVAMCESSR